MKINTTQEFKNLKGDVINSIDDAGVKSPLTLGVVLSEIALIPHTAKNGFRPIKGYELAKKFYNDPEVEIDSADYIQLKELAEKVTSYSTIIIAQALLMLEESK